MVLNQLLNWPSVRVSACLNVVDLTFKIILTVTVYVSIYLCTVVINIISYVIQDELGIPNYQLLEYQVAAYLDKA